MAKNLNLDIDTIFNKEFSVDFKGYSPVEVDQFLDLVCQDYDVYEKTIAELQEKLAFYQDSTDNLKVRIIDLETKLNKAEQDRANQSIANSPVSNISQVDILRRIARLEQEVFSKK